MKHNRLTILLVLVLSFALAALIAGCKTDGDDTKKTTYASLSVDASSVGKLADGDTFDPAKLNVTLTDSNGLVEVADFSRLTVTVDGTAWKSGCVTVHEPSCRVSITFAQENGETLSAEVTLDVSHTHHLTRHAAVAPTLTAEGNIEYWSCTCGKLFSDAAARKEVTSTSVRRIAKVIIMAGQSNMVGHSMVDSLTEEQLAKYRAGFSNVLIYNSCNPFNPKTDKRNLTDAFVPVTAGMGRIPDNTADWPGGCFGPELGLAEYLSRQYPDETFYIIKDATGGTGLHDRWYSPSSFAALGVDALPENSLYAHLLTRVDEGMRLLEDGGINAKIVAFLWMQGEDDSTKVANVSLYDTLWRNLVGDLTADWESKGYMADCGLATVDGGLTGRVAWTYSGQINAIKELYASERSKGHYIDVIGAGLLTKTSDPAHLDSPSMLALGRLYGEKLSLVFADLGNAAVVTPHQFAGSGTETDPYLIGSTADWLALCRMNLTSDLRGVYFRLTEDIGTADAPIRVQLGISNDTPFAGILDGNGKTVTLSLKTSVGIGLIGYAGGATVKNLTVAGEITLTAANFYAGGFIGMVQWADGAVTAIENCVNRATVTATAASNAGGFVGRAYGHLTVAGSTNKGNVTTAGNYAAGILGYIIKSASGEAPSLTVRDTVNEGNITGQIGIGGIVGLFHKDSAGGTHVLENVSNTGTVTGTSQVGGIVATISSLAAGGFDITISYHDAGLTDENGRDIVVGSDGNKKTTAITHTGHTYTLVPEVPATCAAEGTAAHYVCPSCGKLFVLNDGEYTGTTAEALILPAIPHDYTGAVRYEPHDADTHTKYTKCAHCDSEKAETEAHSYGEDHLCVCGARQHVHQGVHHDAVASVSYATAGNTEYWSCEGCDLLFSDADCMTVIDSAVLPAQKDDPDFVNSASTPYLIASKADYEAFAAAVNAGDDMAGKYAKLTADIGDEADPVTVILGRAGAKAFAGSLDGDGHTVCLNVTSATAVGLIGYANGATVKNLTVAGHVELTAANFYAGGFIGLVQWADGAMTTIENCVNTAAVNVTAVSNAAGFVGRTLGRLTVTGCTNKGEITTAGNYAAGILGYIIKSASGEAPSLTVRDTANEGTVTGKTGIGGIVGLFHKDSAGGTHVLENVSNTGTVNGTSQVGGIVATISSQATNGFDITISYRNAGMTDENGFDVVVGSDGNKKITAITHIGHTYTLVPEVPATCAAPGTAAHYVCPSCGTLFTLTDGVYTETTPDALTLATVAHDYTGAVRYEQSDADTHTKYTKCAHCDDEKAETEAHSYTDGTCVCGAEQGHVHAAAHHPAVSASYATAGNAEYWSCEGCDLLFSDETCTDVIDSAVLPAQKDDPDFLNSASTPYLIANMADYTAFATAVNTGDTMKDKYAQLTADIGTETDPVIVPIGTAEKYFAGTFDGAEHTVWVRLSENAAVGLVGYLAGGTVKNVTVRGSVERQTASSASYAGGIVGLITAAGGKVINCKNYAAVTAPSNCYAGGIVGTSNGTATVEDCLNEGTVSAGRNVGGIVGGTGGKITITRAVNRGTVTGSGDYVGGIIGYIHSTGNTLTDCTNTGNVTGAKVVGGIIGLLNGSKTATIDNATVKDCTIGGTQSVGGIVGRIVAKATATYQNYTAPTNVIYKLNGAEETAVAGFDTTGRTDGATAKPGEAFGTCPGTAKQA